MIREPAYRINGRYLLCVLLSTDGSDITHKVPARHKLYQNVTEVGSERVTSTGQCLQVKSENADV